MSDISNSDDVIDSRDVIARIEELESERQNLVDKLDDFDEDDLDNPEDLLEAKSDLEQDIIDWDEENAQELTALKELAEEAENYASDWYHGETLIRESYFTDYCQELVEEIGDLPKDLPGYIVIDWEETANNLRADYTTVDYDGVDYLIRCS